MAWICHYLTLVIVSLAFLASVSILIGWDEMIYLIRHRPSAVWKISLIFTSLLPWIIPILKQHIDQLWLHTHTPWSVLWMKIKLFSIRTSSPHHDQPGTYIKSTRRVSYEELHEHMVELSALLTEPNASFKPKWIIACNLQTTLMAHRVSQSIHATCPTNDMPHILVITQSSSNSSLQYDLKRLIDHCESDDKVLLLNDVYVNDQDQRNVIHFLEKTTRANLPRDIRTACLFCQPLVSDLIKPAYIVKESNEILLLPYNEPYLQPRDHLPSEETEQNHVAFPHP